MYLAMVDVIILCDFRSEILRGSARHDDVNINVSILTASHY